MNWNLQLSCITTCSIKDSETVQRLSRLPVFPIHKKIGMASIKVYHHFTPLSHSHLPGTFYMSSVPPGPGTFLAHTQSAGLTLLDSSIPRGTHHHSLCGHRSMGSLLGRCCWPRRCQDLRGLHQMYSSDQLGTDQWRSWQHAPSSSIHRHSPYTAQPVEHTQMLDLDVFTWNSKEKLHVHIVFTSRGAHGKTIRKFSAHFLFLLSKHKQGRLLSLMSTGCWSNGEFKVLYIYLWCTLKSDKISWWEACVSVLSLSIIFSWSIWTLLKPIRSVHRLTL